MLALAWPSSSETAVEPHVSLILQTELDSAPSAPSAPARQDWCVSFRGQWLPGPRPLLPLTPRKSRRGRVLPQGGSGNGTRKWEDPPEHTMEDKGEWKGFTRVPCGRNVSFLIGVALKAVPPPHSDFRNHFLAVLSWRAAVSPTGAAYLSLQTRGSLCARAALCLVNGLMRLACCPDF